MQAQRSNSFSLMVGHFRVTAILESVVDAPADLLIGISDDARHRRQADSLRGLVPQVTISCFLVEIGSQRILVDAGLGGEETARTGRLLTELARLEVAPADISHVLFTHLHADHVGGALSSPGVTYFRNAQFIAHRAERTYCFDSRPPMAAAPVMAQYDFAQSLRPLLPQFRWAEEGPVLPGIELLHLPGHTPGHSGFRLRSGEASLLIWGDIVHQPLHQFPETAVGTSFDVDPQMATNSRHMIMAHSATTRELIAGSHTDFPTFGHVKSDGAGFRFFPVLWTPEIGNAAAI